YTGQTWIPELGLYHYKARVYSPTLGRFLQTDPTGYDDGLNWYAYVGNDPLNRSDPTGLQAKAGEQTDACQSDFDKTSQCSVLKGESGSGYSTKSVNRDLETQKQDFAESQEENMPEVNRQLLIGGGAIIVTGVTGGAINGLLSGTGLAATADFGLGGGRGLVTRHGLDAMAEHGVSRQMVSKVMQRGEKFLDPKNNSVVHVIRGGMASGKDLAVAVNRLTGKIATVMVNKGAVRPRFLPF
ncbi:RHS repeat-associated core domain-containing protein, partial [Caulobacter sp. Root655]|uniref:RHS repeat-associated core domain-containing protein n=1 Tax=Caulobacter sp. Root655 TaxID=1736578 RepID=UPI000AFF55D6